MATISLQFPSPINASVQVGDTTYFSNPSTLGDFSVGNNITLIGEIQTITDNGTNVTMVCAYNQNNPPPTSTSFILFSKDNLVNLSSLVGYYGNAKFNNNSKDKAELFAASCEVSESSK